MGVTYLKLTESLLQLPRTVEDLRTLYDELLAAEISAEDALDGLLFRAHSVSIRDGAGKIIHTGVADEKKLIYHLELMLEHLASTEVSGLISSVASHLMLELIHPFYDGNGRFGRFLLSAYLHRYLSVWTVLSLSRVMNAEKAKY